MLSRWRREEEKRVGVGEENMDGEEGTKPWISRRGERRRTRTRRRGRGEVEGMYVCVVVVIMLKNNDDRSHGSKIVLA